MNQLTFEDFDGKKIKIPKSKIKKLIKEIENKIWHGGYYKYYTGSNDIEVEFDEEYTEEMVAEKEPDEPVKLIFKATHYQDEEDCNSQKKWRIKVEVDDKFNFKNIERY